MDKLEIGRRMDQKIIIEPSDNYGYIVQVGCGRFVATAIPDLLYQLEQYLRSPQVYQEKYNKLTNPNVPTQTDNPTSANYTVTTGSGRGMAQPQTEFYND